MVCCIWWLFGNICENHVKAYVMGALEMKSKANGWLGFSPLSIVTLVLLSLQIPCYGQTYEWGGSGTFDDPYWILDLNAAGEGTHKERGQTLKTTTWTASPADPVDPIANPATPAGGRTRSQKKDSNKVFKGGLANGQGWGYEHETDCIDKDWDDGVSYERLGESIYRHMKFQGIDTELREDKFSFKKIYSVLDDQMEEYVALELLKSKQSFTAPIPGTGAVPYYTQQAEIHAVKRCFGTSRWMFDMRGILAGTVDPNNDTPDLRVGYGGWSEDYSDPTGIDDELALFPLDFYFLHDHMGGHTNGQMLYQKAKFFEGSPLIYFVALEQSYIDALRGPSI
jgi:hypothetical protein